MSNSLRHPFDQAAAQAERANAQLQLAEQNYDRQAQLFKTNVVAQATLDTATRNLDASKQSFAAAKAEEERARLAYTSNIGGVNTAVAKLRADLPTLSSTLSRRQHVRQVRVS
jgi:Multidrug resistance efflux pump